VFFFCTRCGKIGHDILECSTPWNKITKEINNVIVEASDLRVMYGREDAPMYSNRIRGLPNYEKFRTTRVALGILPRLNFYGEFSGDNGDDDNDSGGSNGGHDPGPSRRRRRRYMSDSESISSDSSCAGGGGGSKQIVPHHDYVGKGKEVMKAAFISSNKLTGDYGMMGRGKHQDTEETRAAGGAPPKERGNGRSHKFKSRHLDGHVANSQVAAEEFTRSPSKFTIGKFSHKSLIGPKSNVVAVEPPPLPTHLINRPPSQNPPSHIQSPLYSSPNSLQNPTSSSSTPNSGMGEFFPYNWTGDLDQPISPGEAHDDTLPVEPNIADNDDWANPTQVPVESSGRSGSGPVESMEHDGHQYDYPNPIPENPYELAQRDDVFGYYGYVSEDTFPETDSASWSQLWRDLGNIDSPTSHLAYPGSHESLQSGSSSSYHSQCRDIPRAEFENLRIFQAIMEDQIQEIEDANKQTTETSLTGSIV
ncbi:hypothetical protein SOVF_074090, partial [Spinacia oleracea]